MLGYLKSGLMYNKIVFQDLAEQKITIVSIWACRMVQCLVGLSYSENNPIILKQILFIIMKCIMIIYSQCFSSQNLILACGHEVSLI